MRRTLLALIIGMFVINILPASAQPLQSYTWSDSLGDVAVSGSCSAFAGYEQYFDIIRLEITPRGNNWYEARLYLAEIPTNLKVNLASENAVDYEWEIGFDIDNDGNLDYSVSVIHFTWETKEKIANIWEDSQASVWKFKGSSASLIDDAELRVNHQDKYISLVFKLPVSLSGTVRVHTYLNAEKYSCYMDDFLSGKIGATQGEKLQPQTGRMEAEDPEGDEYVKGNCEAYKIDTSWYDILRGEAYSDGSKLVLKLWLKKLPVRVPLNLEEKGYEDHAFRVYLDMDGDPNTGFEGYEYSVRIAHYSSGGDIIEEDFWYWAQGPEMWIYEKTESGTIYWYVDEEASIDLNIAKGTPGIIEITINSPSKYTALPARVKFAAELSANRSDLGLSSCFIIDTLELTSKGGEGGGGEGGGQPTPKPTPPHAEKHSDLTLKIKETAPTRIFYGTSLKIQLVISNIGEAASDTSKAVMKADGEIVASASIPPLSPGESVTVFLNWTPAKPGSYIITLFADYYNDVHESNENNNRISLRLNVDPAKNIDEIIEKYKKPGEHVAIFKLEIDGKPYTAVVYFTAESLWHPTGFLLINDAEKAVVEYSDANLAGKAAIVEASYAVPLTLDISLGIYRGLPQRDKAYEELGGILDKMIQWGYVYAGSSIVGTTTWNLLKKDVFDLAKFSVDLANALGLLPDEVSEKLRFAAEMLGNIFELKENVKETLEVASLWRKLAKTGKDAAEMAKLTAEINAKAAAMGTKLAKKGIYMTFDWAIFDPWADSVIWMVGNIAVLQEAKKLYEQYDLAWRTLYYTDYNPKTNTVKADMDTIIKYLAYRTALFSTMANFYHFGYGFYKELKQKSPVFYVILGGEDALNVYKEGYTHYSQELEKSGKIAQKYIETATTLQQTYRARG